MVRTPSIWRWQLIFTGGIVAIAVMIAAFRPATFATPLVVAGFALVILITLATIMVPWDRLPAIAAVSVPLLDAFAIGLTTSTPDIRLGFLWVFPVTWLATYFTMPWVFIGIAFISVCLIAFGNHPGDPAQMMLRVLIVVITLGFLGTTLRIGTQRSRAARRLLQRQSEQVNTAATRAETHQQRVTQIIDVLDTALAAIGEDGVIQRMNDAYRSLYGRDRFGATLPSPAVEYDDRRGEPLPPDQTVLARAARCELMRGERVWLYDSQGRWRALQVSTQQLAGASDAQRTTLIIIDDVTEALEAAENRRNVSAIVSHEVRNPLTAVIGHVDLMLERDDLPSDVVAQLEVVANAGERMLRLVSTALDESKDEPVVLSEPVDLRQVVDASVASYHPTATSQGHTIEVTGRDTLLIYGDAFRLRQVIDNLLSNAVKYTPANGRIGIDLGVDDESRAEVTITDTGLGIAPDELEHLFDPYFRADEARSGGIPGTGLGMGIARDIITAHCGTIDITSEPGVGTSVTLRFPRQREERSTHASAEHSTQRATQRTDEREPA
ncbi:MULTISPECIES: HAMP domain-containing sensor histidine kinase [unclassified Microbacterium]|uniref:sensor histidine kinase n=1 Tax=unclassified Microbacterium TaxID=2609290 RepID=UPI001D7303B4|nr:MULTISPECIES: HAMP domain-containing sensor histidine kinase [unclassified Microbacterium]CAH0214732.1 Alkaline phosphatase synthesis sensor protein PhoR [Microbacterium sp. Bi121]HWK76617.1 HAMP domain-containing sensor histidine kinase [Microbacterium sp.]